MSISIPTTKSASAESIALLEKTFGHKLPQSYLHFLQKHDGATPEPNAFGPGVAGIADVEYFIAARKILNIHKRVDGFPANMLPFAEAAGCNFVYLNPATGAVYFWHHEFEVDEKLTDSFEEFLAGLKPLDLSQIKLKPGQGKVVYANPEFVEEMKRQGLIPKDKQF